MLHDVRDIDVNFFPKRYRLPYFYNKKRFLELLSFLPPASFDEYHEDKYVYTFDDGLKDHLWTAEKLYQKGVRGIFFVPAAPILENKMIDSHKIQFLLASAPEEDLSSYLLECLIQEFEVDELTVREFQKSRWKNNIWSTDMIFITRCLREFGTPCERTFLLTKLFDKYVNYEEKRLAREIYLTVEEVRRIKEMGHLIGGHGVHSYDLRFRADVDCLNEISGSFAFIDNFLSEGEQKMYAYANGGVNEKIHQHCIDRGFSLAFTTDQQINFSIASFASPPVRRIDPFRLIHAF